MGSEEPHGLPTHIDHPRCVAVLEVVEDGRLMEESQHGHVLNLVKLGGVLLHDLVLLDRHCLLKVRRTPWSRNIWQGVAPVVPSPRAGTCESQCSLESQRRSRYPSRDREHVLGSGCLWGNRGGWMESSCPMGSEKGGSGPRYFLGSREYAVESEHSVGAGEGVGV